MRDKPAVLRPYLTVIATDAREIVESAGGLICDRVRQGWRVSIHVPTDTDTRPLCVLGADVEDGAPDRALRTSLLTSASLYADDRAVRTEVESALAAKTTEVLVWGVGGTAGLAAARSVTHLISGAALAFKAHALLAADLPTTPLATTEVFLAMSAAERQERPASTRPVTMGSAT